jgi:energy-coupling factor transporter transmembrane protein EcfT
MRSKEEIMLLWFIAIVGCIVCIAMQPAILLVALFAYSIYALAKHYGKWI